MAVNSLPPRLDLVDDRPLDDPDRTGQPAVSNLGAFSEKELEVMRLLAEAWNKFLELPVQYGWDQREFMHAVHHAQHLVMIRPTRRANPEQFNVLPER